MAKNVGGGALAEGPRAEEGAWVAVGAAAERDGSSHMPGVAIGSETSSPIGLTLSLATTGGDSPPDSPFGASDSPTIAALTWVSHTRPMDSD